MKQDNNQASENKKNVFVVLGMPRSGTSAIARGLKALGINLGDQLIPPRSDWNAKGYWEDNDIVRQVNKKILNTVCDHWETIQILNKNQLVTSSLNPIRGKAIELIKKRFGTHRDWGFKDPRTVRVLPFWQSIFEELELNDHYIIVLRNPLASAYSFHKLTQVDIEKAMLLWLAHLIPALEETQGKKRIVVSYDLMLENPLLQLERIKTVFNIESSSIAAKEEYAKEFLDKKLQHYNFTYEDLKTHPATAVSPVGIKLYDLLFKLAKDEIHFSDAEFIEDWELIKKEYAIYSPLYSYLDKVLKENKILERSVRVIRKSFPWKLIYPIRIIDDKLRELRRRAKLIKAKTS